MGFFRDYVVPNSHNARHTAHLKPKKCVAPGCARNPKPGAQYHDTCGRPACAAAVVQKGGW